MSFSNGSRMVAINDSFSGRGKKSGYPVVATTTPYTECFLAYQYLQNNISFINYSV